MNTIKHEIKNGICLLSLNRPKKYNSFNKELLEELNHTLNELKKNPSLKVLILTGAGSAFSSGADLKELQNLSSIEEARAFALLLEGTSEQIFNFPTPVIAAINGYALGGGMGYAAATDYRIIAHNAKTGFPAIKLGAILPISCSLYLKELIGLSHCKDILLTGRILNAQEAKEMGLVNEIAPSEDLLKRAYELAETIMEGSTDALYYTKKTLNAILLTDLESKKLYAADNFAYLSQTKEWKKRMNDFGKKPSK
ncbi:MAG: enoyl-CoA hydratase [Bacteroidetes bacterium 4572_77]|nr:MAG: enoyl-CoA hydratase [Bacteroidetes bacterium 4572_77]